jgi:hypothetical protein
VEVFICFNYGDIISFSEITAGTTTIALKSALPAITKSITIEGNGVTLTRDVSWVTVNFTSQLLRITIADANAEVTIRRVHFKNGLVENDGGAIYNSEILTLESCIFSGNQTTIQGYNGGGAVYSDNTMTIRGCTFYENFSNNIGGAVCFPVYGRTLTLTGNLFYGNTAYSLPVVYNYGWPVSASYNVVDVALGTASNQSGWAQGPGDTYITTGNPIDPATFAPNAGSPGISDIGIVPAGLPDFPETDFYGNNRTFPGAPGAVNN